MQAFGKLGSSLGSLADKDAYIRKLEEENAKLNETVSELKDNLAKLKAAYDDALGICLLDFVNNVALGIYDMFTNMASISQIMSLGDFKQQMKTTLDKWGNVLNITFARSV